MKHLDIVIVELLVAVAGLALLARLLYIPYPIFLVIGGLVISFLPGVPKIEPAPDMVLLIFLPPLLYAAAFFTSLRDLPSRMDLRDEHARAAIAAGCIISVDSDAHSVGD